MSQLTYLDAQGSPHAIELSVDMYKKAADRNQSLPQYLASTYPTNSEKHGTVFQQLMEQQGLFVRGDREHGIAKSTLNDLLNPTAAANAITREGAPASRFLFPAIVLEAMDNALLDDKSSDSAAFEDMIAVDDSINGDRFERMVVNVSERKHVRAMPVSQLAEPNIMMGITAADVTKRIPTFGIGIEISDQARQQSLDLVTRTIALQEQEERNIRTNDHILALLNGDPDIDMAALADVTGAVTKVRTLDSSITVDHKMTQLAWLKWLRGNGYNTAPVTHIITDFDGYMAYETRAGQPTKSDNIEGVNKPNAVGEIINMGWPSKVKFFITNNPAWPKGTLLGLNKERGIHRVKSLTAEYRAVEEFVMKRSTMMRFDSGEIVYRWYDQAFRVLSLVN